MTTIDTAISNGMTRAVEQFDCTVETGVVLELFAKFARSYIEADVLAWIDATAAAASPRTCGEDHPRYGSSYPCILPAGHDPIAPGVRTHIDQDGDTW